MDLKEIGQRVAAARDRRDMTGEELGKAIGVSKGTISLIENGTGSLPIERLMLLAQALRVDICYLLGIEIENKKPEQVNEGRAAYPTMSEREKGLIKKLRELPDIDQETIYNMCESLYRYSAGKKGDG